MSHRPTVMRTATIVAAGVVCAMIGAPEDARAQIVPPVRVPNVPVLDTPIDVNRSVNGVLGAADPRQLRDLRKLRIRDLLRTNRRDLEADPRGAPTIRNQVAAFSPTPAALEAARAAGFGVVRTRTLEGLGATVVVLEAPEGMSTRRALQRLRDADPSGVYDYNHVYLEGGEVVQGAGAPPTAPGRAIAAPAAIRVGLIDGGVLKAHAAFNSVRLHEHGCDDAPVASAHGTAVASLIVGQANDFHGAAPGGDLYAADVYCGLATGGAVDTIADAFAWLAREQVPVINVSLVGPPNATLEQVVRIVTSRGHVVVAAVGNDGPSAPPLYPAAYPAVVGVTGVDAKERVLLEACRGKHVDLAAPGADMSAAGIEHSYALVCGTSFAAPIVAGLLATRLPRVDAVAATAALSTLIGEATDLGARGPDKIYGNGLVGDALRPPTTLAAIK